VGCCILCHMDTNFPLAQMTVEDVLKKWPQTYSVFRNRKTDCIGCLLQRFCSIQDVAETYELSAQELVGDLERCVRKTINPKGGSNENLFQSH
jgi:hybrid cluster-associated redox disulfide protein